MTTNIINGAEATIARAVSRFNFRGNIDNHDDKIVDKEVEGSLETVRGKAKLKVTGAKPCSGDTEGYYVITVTSMSPLPAGKTVPRLSFYTTNPDGKAIAKTLEVLKKAKEKDAHINADYFIADKNTVTPGCNIPKNGNSVFITDFKIAK